jgi:hypothetical protein
MGPSENTGGAEDGEKNLQKMKEEMEKIRPMHAQ